MSDERELTEEELEAQQGAQLPQREVMSLISSNPGLISIPEEPPQIIELDDPNDPI